MRYEFKLCLLIFVVVITWIHFLVSGAVRLSESHYRVKSYGDNNTHLEDFRLLPEYTNAENSCLPARILQTKQAISVEELQRFTGRESIRNLDSTLSGCSIYVDPGISSELRNKVKLCIWEQIPRYFVIILAICEVFHMIRSLLNNSQCQFLVLVNLVVYSSALGQDIYLLCIVW